MRNNLLFTAIFLLFAAPLFSQTQIQDADGDTRVQTEASPDEDRIRFRVGGAEVLTMRRTANGFVLFENFANGANVFLGEKAGEASTAGGANVFIGFSAGKANTEAGFNTFVGAQSGQSNTTGTPNTFIGGNAGFLNTTGGFNVFVGDSAGVKNTTASLNTFVGHAAGRDNTTFSGNTFIGANAGANNATGDAHVFVGKNAGASTVNNSTNTYVGSEAGMKSTAGFNTFVGGLAGRNATTGSNNTCLGAMTGTGLSTGSENVLLGSQAGLGINSGSKNVSIGRSSGSTNTTSGTFLGHSAHATGAFSNVTALGNGATVNTNNKIRLGNTAVLVIEGNVAYTVSDGRFKRDVRADAPGLDFVMGLRPVTYHFNYTDFSKFLGEENVDQAVLAGKDQARELGFVAQDVERLCAEQGVAVSNLVHVPDGEVDNYSVAYGQFVVPLVQAVQEQQAQIAALQSLVEAQQVQLATLQNLLAVQLRDAARAPAPALDCRPNPTGGALQVSLRGIADGATLSLFSADGALMRVQPAREGLQTLDLGGLPAGTYFLQTGGPGQAPVSKTIVKSAE